MYNVIRLTFDFLLEHKIDKLPVDLSTLGRLCNDLGFDLLSYAESQEIIQRFGLKSHTQNQAFTYQTLEQDVRIICYDDALSTSDKLFSIAHEIAHVFLNHTCVGAIGKSDEQSVQEREADAAAYHLLAPIPVLAAMRIETIPQIASHTLLTGTHAQEVKNYMRKYQRQPNDYALVCQFGLSDVFPYDKRDYRVPIKYVICLMLCVAIVCGYFLQKPENDHVITTLPASASSDAPDTARQDLISSFKDSLGITDDTTSPAPYGDELVYVTPSGKKYHKPDCQYVRENENVEAITIKEAKERRKTPCKVCQPGE